ncbi:MAG TPA: tetraacyldisaccharide 4'-kinase [Terriglobia bacterium]|nr:tetraacyldisaccharide 4'-kinase [Terriglobia bacterium]
MSRAFRLLLGARERMYRAGLLRTMRLKHPVVSVGNLTLGGTGKTPLVIALAERFRKDGFSPVVLSRGYKRTSKGVRIVSRGNGPIVNWRESGDEPFLIARRTSGVSVVVGVDRFEAGQHAEREGLGDLFILDDGFQHRGLYRDVDLVTVDPREWAAGEKLLPNGRWREPKSAIERAHAACIQDRSDVPNPHLPIPTFQIQTVSDGIYKGSNPVALQTLQRKPVVAFAGIAKPERFFEALENMDLSVSRRLSFRDHHIYTPDDIARIGEGDRTDPRITTEKDSIRLEDAGIGDFLHLRISANIPEFDRLMDLIRSRFS